VCLAAILAAHSAAQPTPSPKTPLNPGDLRGVESAERSARPASQPRSDRPSQPPALLNGRPITWDDLHTTLAEAAGGQALQETILDLLLDDQVASKGIVITPADIEAERALLLGAIRRDAQASPDNAERLLESVRRSRGLGETRFAKLLERNARMRRLVAPAISVTSAEVEQAFQMLHGPKFKARVIVAPSHQRAAALRDQLLADPDHIRPNFIALAAAESSDPSGPRGGMIDPISPADPQYPASVRDAASRLKPGEISPVLAVDRGFALLLLEETIPPDSVELSTEADRIRAEVRLRRERLAMDDLARRLLRSAEITITDRALDWSYRGVQTGEGRP